MANPHVILIVSRQLAMQIRVGEGCCLGVVRVGGTGRDFLQMGVCVFVWTAYGISLLSLMSAENDNMKPSHRWCVLVCAGVE